MAFYIVGTAGHIDHGKTELSKALTGIQTDRLKEEQERGMSIKLGFAPLSLSQDLQLGLVDVPGHERFIQQMLSGAFGMDLVLLVVAATEGIMPQTREHLDIIRLLGIPNLLVALTKKSLVEQDFLELVQEDVRDYLAGHGYPEAPVIPVDSISGEGLDELKAAMEEALRSLPQKDEGGFPRLPVDRVFSLTGHGTVVTGTLWSGRIAKGDSLTLFPMGKSVKVRNIQVHGKNVEEAIAGQRVALNIPDAGSAKSIPSGQVLIRENILSPTYKVTGLFHLLPEKDSLSHLEKVRVHLGTGETLGKLLLLEKDEIWPGEEALCGLYLDKPLGTVAGDRLILRKENASETLGGVTVIEAAPGKIRRKEEDYLEALRRKLQGSPLEKLLSLVREEPFSGTRELARKLALEEEAMKALLADGEESLLSLEGTWLHQDTLAELEAQLLDFLRKRHEKNPLSPGASKEELKSRFFPGLQNKVWQSFLKLLDSRSLTLKGDLVSEKGVVPILSPADEKGLDLVVNSYLNDGFSPLSPQELADSLHFPLDKVQEYIHYLQGQEQLVKIDETLYFHREVFQKALDGVIAYCQAHDGAIDIAGAKEVLGSSRKYIVPFLEYLDYHKWTRRLDNKRVLLRRN